ncbi:MAG: cbb3-type cytochrome oxidase assembly protein CcoS [Thermodesulfobacteriota bacterium]
MYFPYWMMLVGVSVWASILAFVWALRSGQFEDQGRARYLPLRDAAARPAPKASRPILEVCMLLLAVGLALAGLIVAAVLTLLGPKGG